MQLSKHFKLEEFTKSMTATRKGIKNEPGSGDIKNLENICYEILEPVRAKFDKPVTMMMVQRVGSIVVTMKKVQTENRYLLMMEKNLIMVFLK